MLDLIVLAIIVIILGLAISYIVVQKKRGAKCIGCGSEAACSKKNESGCSCKK